jgi:thymidylate synthase (FAD)
MLELIEESARVCCKSEPDSADPYKVMCKALKRGHESVIEHSMMTVRFVANRGFSHELVRHRLAAFSQESTRYCDYSKVYAMVAGDGALRKGISRYLAVGS